VIKPEQLRFFFLARSRTTPVDFDPIGTDAVPRLYDEFDRFAAATAGKEVRGEIAPASRTRSATRCSTRMRTSPPRRRVPAAVRATSRCSSRSRTSTSRADDGGEGERADERERRSSTSGSSRPRLARLVRAGQGAARGPRDACPRARRRSTTTSAATSRALADRAGRHPAPATLAGRDLRRPPTDAGSTRTAAFAAIYLAFLGRTNGPRAGWLLASLDPASSSTAARGGEAPVGGPA
jgi:lysyl-tRNA synthetase class I